ncbi:MAG: aldehyde dehydrogenase family protein [Rhodocyclaceae bacterium]|nr:aldehyde dehydrogenase family protein [Rhodocyclaceae bacterium]
MSADLLARLGIAAVNPAAATGDGAWRAGTGRFDSVNPASGVALAAIGRAGDDDYAAVLEAAMAAQKRWQQVPAPRRGLFVRELADALRAVQDDLATLVTLETGKIRAEGLGEVREMIDIADFAVGLSRQLYGLTLASERPQHRMMEQWHPLGVVGCITAFNFPLAVWSWNAFIAAVCGDTVVWKPSPKAPLCAIAVQRIVDRIAARHGADGVFTLLLADDPALGRRLAEDRRIALLSFTGASSVGRDVAARVAARLGRCLLECSGNNAVIVDTAADFQLAVPAIVFGAIGTAGQRCTSTRRLIVAAARREELVARLAHAYGQLRIGDPLQPATLMGPLIDAEAVAAYSAALDEAVAAGGRVLAGGRRLPGPGYFVEPALVAAENAWPVVQRETFAPILYVIEYSDFEQAIALNNAVPQGLSSALFTLDLRRAERFVSATGSDCGIANVNLGTSGAEIGGAFGGEKDTGGGREAGSDAWKSYMRRQTNTINWGDALPLAQGIRFELGGD